MIHRFQFIGVLLVSSSVSILSAAEPVPRARGLRLTGERSEAELAASLRSVDSWSPFPRAIEREAWEGLLEQPLNVQRQSYLVERAVALLGQPWPPLPATLYMEFARDGNRSRYEDRYFTRRENLATLVLAECFEHRGRFLDEIVNGIWAVCEESTWCLPAHASRYRGDVLHRPDVESLDLFACETGMSLAQIRYLLGAELDGVSRTVGERIRQEVTRRIIDPYAAGDTFGSSGWTRGGNNWAPWCASNVLGATFYLEEDPERVAPIAFRLMQVVDRFVDNYGEDGGCDEGPSYWNEAAGAMLVFLELLRSRTDGEIDIYDEPKIRSMGEFIVHAHLAGPWFANFADADPKSAPHPGKVFRFGQRLGSPGLEDLALYSMREWSRENPVDPPIRLSGISRSVLGPLMEVFWIPATATPGPLRHREAIWLPDLQVLYARESTVGSRGLVVAAKGGHNAESHNHNDVGHFMVFLDGSPGIIDIGRETYTRTTFSSNRYTLWFTRGQGHNAPVVEGVEQQAGRQYRAVDVQFQEKGSSVELGMRLDEAYPESAGLESLRRELVFERGDDARFVVRDVYALRSDGKSLSVTLYAVGAPEESASGRIAIPCGERPLLLEYDPARLRVACEPVELSDPALQDAWGNCLHRVQLTTRSTERNGGYALTFRAGSPLTSEPAAPH